MSSTIQHFHSLHNSPFVSQQWPYSVTYPWWDGQVELAWLAGYISRRFTYLNAVSVTYTTTNHAQHRATLPQYCQIENTM